MSETDVIERVPSEVTGPQLRESASVDVAAELEKLGVKPATDKSVKPVAEPTDDQPEPVSPDSAEPVKEDRPSKRAKSQDAGPEDVPRIRELTAKWRTEESARKALEAKVAELEARVPKTEPAVTEPTVPDTFKTPEPQLAQFQTYEEWMRAMTRWEIQRDRAASDAQTAQTQQAKQVEKDWEKTIGSYRERAREFAKGVPNFDEALASFDDQYPDYKHTPVMQMAILTSDRGPEIALHLAKHPQETLQLIWDTQGRQVSEETVATLQRLLSTRLAAAPSGSASQSTSVSRATKPIKPVGGSPTVPEPELADLSVDDFAARWRKNRSFLRK